MAGTIRACTGYRINANLERPLMKLVSAIIKPFKLDEVREALSQIGVQGKIGRAHV